MNFEKALLTEHSRVQAEKIAKYIGKDSARFKVLMDIFFCNEYILTQRAASVMSICVRKYPDLISPFLKKMIYNLEKPVHDSVKRNTVRILQEIEIPEKLIGKTVDVCFALLAKPSEAVAIKAFSMTVLLNITKKEPDLKNELKIIIEDQLPYAKAAFISRGKKTLKELEKLS
ncbi:MAG TPA: hypothetical protein VNW06_06995 [Cytophagaceae bacterium]|nr:hypothetical protein [Cytophagaceae bacterium]